LIDIDQPRRLLRDFGGAGKLVRSEGARPAAKVPVGQQLARVRRSFRPGCPDILSRTPIDGRGRTSTRRTRGVASAIGSCRRSRRTREDLSGFVGFYAGALDQIEHRPNRTVGRRKAGIRERLPRFGPDGGSRFDW